MVEMSLEKKLKQKAWHHDCITEVVELETAQKELGLVAQQIREIFEDELEEQRIQSVNSDVLFAWNIIKKRVLGLLVEDSEEIKTE